MNLLNIDLITPYDIGQRENSRQEDNFKQPFTTDSPLDYLVYMSPSERQL